MTLIDIAVISLGLLLGEVLYDRFGHVLTRSRHCEKIALPAGFVWIPQETKRAASS